MSRNELTPQVIQELSATAFRVAMGVLRNRDQALDIAQEVLLGTHENLDRLHQEGGATGYVARSAYNRSLNIKRDTAARRDKLAGGFAMNHPAPTSEPGEQAQRRAILDAAVDKLAQRQGQALTLRFFQGLKIGEIALVMAISEGAVKTHLARGLINLKTMLKEFEGAL